MPFLPLLGNNQEQGGGEPAAYFHSLLGFWLGGASSAPVVGQSVALQGSIDCHSAFNGNATKAHGANSSDSTRSDFDGLLSVSKSLDGIIRIQSDFDGSLTVQGDANLSGIIQCRATFGAAPNLDSSSNYTVSGDSQFDGQLGTLRGIQGNVRCQSTFSGSLSVESTTPAALAQFSSPAFWFGFYGNAQAPVNTVSLAGAFHGRSTFGAAPNLDTSNNYTVSGDSQFDGQLGITRLVQGQFSGHSTFSGALDIQRENSIDLIGAFNGRSIIGGNVANSSSQSGSEQSDASFNGLLSLLRQISGSISAESSFGHASVLKTTGFVTIVSGDSDYDGNMSKAAGLTGIGFSPSYISGQVSVSRAIQGNFRCQSRFAASLQVDHDGVAELIGSISADSVFGSTASVTHNSRGSEASDSSFNGLLSVIRSLAGAMRCRGTFGGSLESGHDTTPALVGSFRGSSTFNNNLRLSKGLQTQGSTDSLISGSLSVTKNITGRLGCQSRFGGDLFVPVSLGGAVRAESELSSRATFIRGLNGAILGDSGCSTGVLLHREFASTGRGRARFTGGLSISSLVDTFEIVNFTLRITKTRENELQITQSKSFTLER